MTTTRAALGIAILALGVMSCEREERRLLSKPMMAPATATTNTSQAAGASDPSAAPRIDTKDRGPFDHNAYGTTEGQILFNQMNCSGCHSNGGGGMGPPLMDDKWRYGYSPDEIFATIADGRENGMPAWRSRLNNEQIWELVAYVRSLSGLTPKGDRPSRDDHMMVKPAPSQTPNAVPRNVRPVEQH